MKKLINDPLQVVSEMVEGLVLADDRLTRIAGENVVLRRDHAEHAASGKVALISGGGAGHEPAHAGYIGQGMLTAAVVGEVFTSPSVDAVLAAILAVAGPAGVLLIVKNYTGDRLNFGLAAELARASGVTVDVVVVGDDVALDTDDGAVGRRGIAGTVLVHKVAGAAAEAGLSLAEVKREAQAAIDAVFSMGLGLGACIVPAAGTPGFELSDTEVEYGLGIHGERGAKRGTIAPADAMLDTLLDRLLERSGLRAQERVALLVNNLGGTAVQELGIVARHALKRLEAAKIEVALVQVGTFLTALEMPGCSLSLMRLDEARRERLLAPASAAAWSVPTHPVTVAPAVKARTLTQTAQVAGPAWTSTGHSTRFAGAIRAVTGALQKAEHELTDLDSVVGDGDIGLSLARGARGVEAALPELDKAHPAVALQTIASVLRRELGGTSGPLYAAFVVRAASHLAERDEADSADAWAAAFRAGIEGVQALGGGKAGDRTMLDALIPAADAMDAAVSRGDAAPAVVQAAIKAAHAGVEATKQMRPRLGRSSYLGDRALGHADPGAFAVALWLEAIGTTFPGA
ncbi:homodimeric dihydroxyacetone kinase [Luteibacter sp. OK325]|uniref:dihydroxyacetone kinase subunit DhaL n=1 Tax=Luteibacter sp. OK325 TaxID=2135670 RepID=UPI000D34A270|nr:dihydroxyacetone kinase subunit DhaL [Luteibacter sp. OK325]PTR33898.1 homodimeric dihydroxyacetone kinase [Luteibacter sp. OK325]